MWQSFTPVFFFLGPFFVQILVHNLNVINTDCCENVCLIWCLWWAAISNLCIQAQDKGFPEESIYLKTAQKEKVEEENKHVRQSVCL